MKKRILGIVLTLCMVLALMPQMVFAETYGDFEYSVSEETNEVTITGYNGSGGAVEIPSRINDMDVTAIGDEAFSDCTSLKSITIPNSVTSIGDTAFWLCTSLKSITIPNSVTSIGRYVFIGCESLISITIPNSVTSIGDKAFMNCRSLTSITIPNSMTSIGINVFLGCKSLTSITIPNSVTSIDTAAFSGCSELKDVYYLGTEEEWKKITIGSSNNDLTNSRIYYIGYMAQGVTFTPPSNLTYDGTTKEATVTKNNKDLGDITIKYYDKGDKVYVENPVDAGIYAVKIDIEKSQIYEAISGYEVGQFEIRQAKNSFTTVLSIGNLTYGDTPNPTAAAKFGTPTYSYSTEENGTYTTDQPTNVGTYWVKATIEETKNYTGLEDKIQFTILPKIYTVTYSAGSNGAGNVAVGSKTQDVAFTLSSKTFTRAGYEQTGWATSDGGEKVYDLGGTYTANADITLYPAWSDITNPTGEISIGKNSWKTSPDNITFDLFFKDMQTVTITASDNSAEEVTIGYLLSDHKLSPEIIVERDENGDFIPYNDGFNIIPDRKCLVYAKLTDKTGNVTYINSNGIVLDGTSPVISGIENGKTYCSSQTFTVAETYLDKVIVNGEEVELDGSNQYTLDPAEGIQTIVAIDKADNKTEITVTVNDGHKGGKATCMNKAACEYCGEAYSEIDSTNHNLEKIPAKAATANATGNIEYWHCKDCGKYFADEKGTKEIKLEDTVVAANVWTQTVLRLQAAASKTSIKLKWNAVPEADGYVIYWNKCGAKNGFKQVKVIESGKILTWTHKNLKKNTWNKYYVKAYKLVDGKKTFIKTSNRIHLTTKGGKYTNVKKLKSGVSSVTLNIGKTKALKITQIYVEKNKKIVKHMRPLTYTTSDKKVATVTSKGVIKAKGTGSCYIYITAHNGVYTRVKVTVK